MSYKFVEGPTSDVMFEVEASDLAKLLEQASLALFEVMCQIKQVKPLRSVAIRIEENNEKDLLHSWLTALIAEFGANEMFFSKFDVKVSKKGKKLVAIGKAYGESISAKKGGVEVKGITYYNFDVKKTKKGYKATVVGDI
jgi:SHS2 domain-containing protein